MLLSNHLNLNKNTAFAVCLIDNALPSQKYVFSLTPPLNQRYNVDNFRSNDIHPLTDIHKHLYTNFDTLVQHIKEGFPATLRSGRYTIQVYMYDIKALKQIQGQDRCYIPILDCQLLDSFFLTPATLESFANKIR